MTTEERKMWFSPHLMPKYTAEYLINKVEGIIADFQKKNPQQVNLLLDVAVAIIKEIGALKGY